MIALGAFISVIFSAIAFLCSILSRDKAKGIGLSILLWLFFSLLFDGIIMFLLFQLSDYPIEHWIALVTALNPIDLARITMLLQVDQSALLGYTGAVFKENFGSTMGIVLATTLLCVWLIAPFMISLIKFNKKDH
jgi:Cu-processing system permease protein